MKRGTEGSVARRRDAVEGREAKTVDTAKPVMGRETRTDPVVSLPQLLALLAFLACQFLYGMVAASGLYGDEGRFRRAVVYFRIGALLNAVAVGIFLVTVVENPMSDLANSVLSLYAIPMLVFLGTFYVWGQLIGNPRRRRLEHARWRDKYVGQQGVVVSDLHPTGRIHFDGQFHDARAADTYIETGRRVKVTGRSGDLLVVQADPNDPGTTGE